MKSFVNILSLCTLLLIAGTFHACENLFPEKPGKGSLEISINTLSGEDLLKSALNDTVPPDTSVTDTNVVSSHHIVITVLDENGTPVMEDELIPLYNFGNGYVSKKIELDAGSYNLTKFMVINPEGRVVFAAPLEGSPKAYLVNKCLPINFVITPESVTRVIPEVLTVVNESPEEFGYAAFGFHVVKPLAFYVMAVIIDENARDIISGTPTEALLTVYAPNGWQYSFKLKAAVNRLEIRGGSEYYILVGEKEGYPAQKLRFSARELFNSSKDNPVIIRFIKTQINVLTLKPGPENGKDAMISNLEPEKNFGDHPYFEATFISEPVLTVMRSNSSLIWFDLNALPKSAQIKRVVLTLFADKPISWNYEGAESPESSVKPWYGAVLQQIVEPWDEYKVTWKNQPKTIEANQVYITPFVSPVNYINIDVTKLYAPVDANTTDIPNYGMFFKLYPKEEFPGFRFASSDHPEPRLHPELKIFYTLP
jgi:hypothetical protein